MIGGFMAAHSLQRFQAVTCSNKFMRDAVFHNQNEIVQYAFNSINSPYRTTGQLYYGRSSPENLHLGHFFRIARIHEIAIQLAIALADQHDDIASRVTYEKFIENAVPYIITLGHFFECFRDGLASWLRRPSANVGFSLLCRNYNDETRRRICALYQILKDVLDRQLPSLCYEGMLRNEHSFFHAVGTRYSNYFDVFTFAGLEAVKDIMLEPSAELRATIVSEHFARVSPDSFLGFHIKDNHFIVATQDFPGVHTLPPSTLPQLSSNTVLKISQLLPHLPPLSTPRGAALDFHGFPREGWDKEKELERFYNHLVNYDGDEPEVTSENFFVKAWTI